MSFDWESAYVSIFKKYDFFYLGNLEPLRQTYVQSKNFATSFFFTEYLTSPGSPHPVGWSVGDMEPTDGDADIDLADFAAFQNAFTGPE